MENMIVKTVFEICKSAETITFAYIVYPLTPHKHTHHTALMLSELCSTMRGFSLRGRGSNKVNKSEAAEEVSN